MEIYKFNLVDNTGQQVPMSDFKDKVVLIVNTATGCGFTNQYEFLEKLYNKYKDKGFEIIDIPCNQFGNQAPGSDEEIAEFCALNYGVSFLQMRKADVNGENQLDLYKFLKEQQGFKGINGGIKEKLFALMLKAKDKNYKNNNDIKWNFTKFLIDRSGQVISRFEPTDSLQDLENSILNIL